jgi:hypothetical protein
MAAKRAAERKPRDPAAAPEPTVDSGGELPEAPHPQRPNAPGLRCLARAHAAAAVEALAAVMRDPTATPAARVSAAGALLAWGYGKAGQGEDGRRARTGDQIVRLVWGGDDA